MKNLKSKILLVALALPLASRAHAGADDIPPPPSVFHLALYEAQLALLPSEQPVTRDAGSFLPLPGGAMAWMSSAPPGGFGLGLSIALYEDPSSRDLVLLGPDGATLLNIPPPEGYSPSWVYELLNPDAPPGEAFPPSYDPSLVTLHATLECPLASIFLDWWNAAIVDHVDYTDPIGPTEPTDPANPTDSVASVNPVEPADPADPSLPSPTGDEDPPPAGIIYVDARNGDDTLTGRSDGPKRTLRGGMSALDGDTHTLVIREGDYAEPLDLRGHNVRVVIEGHVRLKESRI